jgi:hypothetical protein
MSTELKPVELADNDVAGLNTAAFPGNIAFAPALLDPDLAIPGGMVGPDGKPAPKRFSVYRNNVIVSLMEALAETYPSLRKLVGEENFAIISRIFISKHPPTSAMMQAYGDGFADFLDDFEPLAHAPFLSDVANLEMAWIKTYHAADAQPLDGALLGDIEPEELMATCFETHPATRIKSSQYRLLELFQIRNENSAELPDQSVTDQTQAVLVTRPFLSVEVNQLDHAQYEFFNVLISGQPLGQAVETAIATNETFDASAAITLMLVCGAFTNITKNKQH